MSHDFNIDNSGIFLCKFIHRNFKTSATGSILPIKKYAIVTEILHILNDSLISNIFKTEPVSYTCIGSHTTVTHDVIIHISNTKLPYI